MYAGLKLLGWEESRLRRRKVEETNIDQYRGMYGVDPCVIAKLINDLQTTEIDDAFVEKVDVDKLHWAIHWMYRYPTETESESIWNKCAIEDQYIKNRTKDLKPRIKMKIPPPSNGQLGPSS